MEQKWPIPSLPETEAPWDRDHESGYANIWSLTPDVAARENLINFIPLTAIHILIPGCGSETHLQRHILQSRGRVEEVYCTDWSQKALDRARASFDDPRVRYRRENTADLPFGDATFDVVLVVNSILSSDDRLNRAMIKECCRVLKPDGLLVGYFPTILCALDISYLDPSFAAVRDSGAISLDHSAFYEAKQGLRQIFYTPLRLARIVKEAGFRRERFEIVFFDSEPIQRETERVYGIPAEADLFIWEILAVLRK